MGSVIWRRNPLARDHIIASFHRNNQRADRHYQRHNHIECPYLQSYFLFYGPLKSILELAGVASLLLDWVLDSWVCTSFTHVGMAVSVVSDHRDGRRHSVDVDHGLGSQTVSKGPEIACHNWSYHARTFIRINRLIGKMCYPFTELFLIYIGLTDDL